jgi:hypothetical protein
MSKSLDTGPPLPLNGAAALAGGGRGVPDGFEKRAQFPLFGLKRQARRIQRRRQ